LLACEDVFDCPAAVVDQLPEIPAVAAAATVLRRQNRVPLLHQLADDVDVAGVEPAMDPAVDQHDKRQLGSGRLLPGQESVSAENHRVACALPGRVPDDS